MFTSLHARRKVHNERQLHRAQRKSRTLSGLRHARSKVYTINNERCACVSLRSKNDLLRARRKQHTLDSVHNEHTLICIG